MGSRDSRIDEYIAKSADFAKPILHHIRDLVHTTCPDVEETMKSSFLHFQKPINTALEWLAQGKSRHWKYERR